MIYLIIGRFASGRKYLADILKKQIEPDEKPNETVLSAITDTDSVVQNNILIIQPNRLNDITKADPSEAFEIIHTEADDMDRLINYVKASDKKINADKEFDSVCKNEDSEFCQFESMMHDIQHNKIPSDFPNNVTRCYHYVNNFDPATTDTYVNEITMNHTLNKETAKVIAELNKAGLIQKKRNDNLISTANSAVNSTFFAELIIDNNENFADIMKRWLIYKSKPNSLKPISQHTDIETPCDSSDNKEE